VFLHPSQRQVVYEDYSGPARVTGGAGTGKTVVALHRAARLAREYPEAKILLTTFSKTLAARLQQNLERLVGVEAPELERIDVTNLHNLAVERWNTETGSIFKPFHPHEGLLDLVHEAIEATGGSGFSADWLRAEWETIIDTEGIRCWEEYQDFPRAGRGSPLSVGQRREVWPVFEHIRNALEKRGERTWQGLCYDTAARVSRLDQPLYDHVIADEIQDFGPAELRLLRALTPEADNDLFVTGDLGQRIYKGKTSFLGAGIDIRGRSTILDINYRTTEQIRRYADKILPAGLSDADGVTEARTSVSLHSGPEPTFAFESNAQREIEAAAKWLQKQLSNGFKPEEIAIFVRTNKLVRERPEHVVGKCGLQSYELRDDEPPRSKCVSIGTMHRAKGLEFRAVLVMGCEDDVVPYQSAYSKQPDTEARAAFLDREQNLLYVACTRARDRLFVSGAGEKSRFLRG
jgi:superfamily I DNA/RNA helicase